MKIKENSKKWGENHGKNMGYTYKITCTWAVNKPRSLKRVSNKRYHIIPLKCDIRKICFSISCILLKTFEIGSKNGKN